MNNLDLIQKQLVDDRLDLIVHLSPQHIIELAAYEKFVEQTMAKRHFKLNESNQFSNLRAPHEVQLKLNELDANIFPMLRYDRCAREKRQSRFNSG